MRESVISKLTEILISEGVVDNKVVLGSEEYNDIIEQLDSLSYFSVMVRIEDEFAITLPEVVLTDNALKNIVALADIIEQGVASNF